MGQITAEIVAHSLSPQRDELISVLCTFPRIILAEVNTHRMLSKNTSSSRAIPFKKMLESIQDDPFIPIAWQKEHKGMQGSEYIIDEREIAELRKEWINARNSALVSAMRLNSHTLDDVDNRKSDVTKQLCNRLLEPFMWTTMLITGPRSGWDNFFNLRCPNYDGFKSKKEASEEFLEKGNINTSTWSELDWLKLNTGQAEIHIMDLAEKIYDAMNESIPNQLEVGEWHIPFVQNLDLIELAKLYPDADDFQKVCVKISTAMAARTSYTVVGEEKEVDYKKMIELHDRLLTQDPPHSSPMEHCCLCVSEEEYNNSFKGVEKGWFRNYRGFKSYREIIETKKYGDI